MEPAGDRGPVADRGGPGGQLQEGALEGVLGLLPVAEGAAADVEDHRGVPLEQGVECGLVTAGDEAIEQIGIADLFQVGGDGETPDLTQHVFQRLAGHGYDPPQRSRSQDSAARAKTYTQIWKNRPVSTNEDTGGRVAGTPYFDPGASAVPLERLSGLCSGIRQNADSPSIGI